MQKLFITFSFLLAIWVLPACTPSKQAEISDKPKIVATTGMVADAVENLLGNKVELKILMGAGVDPHPRPANRSRPVRRLRRHAAQSRE